MLPGVLSLVHPVFLFRDMKKIDDRDIAKRAEQMLGSALRSKTSSFADHVKRPADKASLKDAEAKSRLKQYGLLRAGTKQYYLRAISIRMAKHGFIRHYGVDGQRSAGSRTRKKPRSVTYHFKNHVMKQSAKPFLDQVIQSSGVVPYVVENITKNRAEEVAQNIAITLTRFD